MENNTLKMALEYTKLGWSVIPINPGSKKPIVSWIKYQNVRATPEQITEWWTNWPNANIGIVTGTISNLLVIDVEKDGNAEGYPETVTSKTGGGGFHFYYSYPEQNIKNSCKFKDETDIRGNGGYVVAPPSLHQSGERYKWQCSPFDNKISPLSDNLLNEILDYQNKNIDIETNKTNWAKEINNKVLEGARNDTATKFVGKLLSSLDKDLWEPMGWPAIKEWNKNNCEPPLAETELRLIWESIQKAESSARLITKKGYQTTKPDDLITSTKQGSISSSKANLDINIFPEGTFISDLLKYADEITDAPNEFIVISGLSAIATVLKDNVWLDFGNQKLRPHLYLVLLGISSIVRKSTSINIVDKIVYKASSLTQVPYDIPGDITPESILELLSEKPYGLFTISELGGFLKK